ncbi:hypothetical protein [Streptomyces sp. NPDC056921]|uniref:hypothetical protein n=1 Tax=Streptomyces sp. NPDC056921 TaxID=3345966 RepID=UPI0036342FF3
MSLRIVRQGKPSGAYTDSRMSIDDLEEAVAAEVRAGQALMVEVRLMVRSTADSLPVVRDTLFNRVTERESVGFYHHPEQILDPLLRRDATDMWAAEFGIDADDLVRWRGRTYRVIELEDVDREYGEVGYRTGYAICHRTDSPPGGQCNPKRLRVNELTCVSTDSAATQQTDQSVSNEKTA